MSRILCSIFWFERTFKRTLTLNEHTVEYTRRPVQSCELQHELICLVDLLVHICLWFVFYIHGVLLAMNRMLLYWNATATCSAGAFLEIEAEGC